jgi:hypothetical protein
VDAQPVAEDRRRDEHPDGENWDSVTVETVPRPFVDIQITDCLNVDIQTVKFSTTEF